MLAALAQQTTSADSNLFEIMTNLFSRGDVLAHPDQLVAHLQALSIVWGVVFITAGLTCMLNGYKFYKTVVVVLALAIGMFAGYYLGERMDAAQNATNARYIVGGCLGALLAVVAFPLMKYAVAAAGGLVGAFIGANSWSAIASHMAHGQPSVAADNYWVGALVGLLLFGMLAFIVFKLSVVVFTSVSGATVAVMGAMALLLQVPQWRPQVTESVSSHAMIMPLLVLVPAVIGLILQQSRHWGEEQGGKGKIKAKTAEA